MDPHKFASGGGGVCFRSPRIKSGYTTLYHYDYILIYVTMINVGVEF